MKSSRRLLLWSVAVATLPVCVSSRLSPAESTSGVTFSWGPEKATSANAAIMAYLGDPVPPPPNVDSKYTPDGLMAAFRQLCQKLGFKVQRLAVDEAEFPFLVYGIIEGRQDYNQIKHGLAQMPGYAYGGSVTGSSNGATYFALNMMPHREYPRSHVQAIQRRNMIRLQMLGAIWRDPVH